MLTSVDQHPVALLFVLLEEGRWACVLTNKQSASVWLQIALIDDGRTLFLAL